MTLNIETIGEGWGEHRWLLRRSDGVPNSLTPALPLLFVSASFPQGVAAGQAPLSTVFPCSCPVLLSHFLIFPKNASVTSFIRNREGDKALTVRTSTELQSCPATGAQSPAKHPSATIAPWPPPSPEPHCCRVTSQSATPALQDALRSPLPAQCHCPTVPLSHCLTGQHRKSCAAVEGKIQARSSRTGKTA